MNTTTSTYTLDDSFYKTNFYEMYNVKDRNVIFDYLHAYHVRVAKIILIKMKRFIYKSFHTIRKRLHIYRIILCKSLNELTP